MKLNLKVSLSLGVALASAMSAFILLIIDHQSKEIESEISRHVAQISDVVVKSTRYAMLVNKRDIAEKIIADIGKQDGIEHLRVISADGTIIHSNHNAEVGYSVEPQDGPCAYCHQTSKPLLDVPEDQRWKITVNAQGSRSLSAMQVIHNDRSCATASCHEHSPKQTVLGIVDVVYSLEEIDQKSRAHAVSFIAISLGFILVVALGVGALLQRLIYLPLKDLASVAEKISAGDLDHAIPVRSNDEFGRVAASFNEMTQALSASRLELHDLIETLEQKVKERTQELLVAEAEVLHGQKLASVGVLAAGIAHELNNPLTGVLTFTSLLRKKMADGSEDAEDLDLVIRETKRCASIIKRLLDFAREKVPVKGLFDVNRVIDDTLRFTERPASLRQIEIITDLDPQLPQVWGDADLIKQVILNILVNAQQAIEAQGNIWVSSRPHVAKTPAKPGVIPVPMVEIVVRDTGCGIPEANLQRIFDPFFTSKEVGKGTGLGLSVSYGIIKAHGGRINVESVVGEGTTFHILLPITSPYGDGQQDAGESSK
jgi:two-component system NtrC family sensor kinase